MLDGLRSFAKSGPGKILGAFLLVGVAGFGINNVILDFGNNTVARVGDQEISSQDFQRAYSQEINGFAQQFGSFPTNVEAEQMGLPSNVIQRLSQDAALDNMASDFGLGVTDAKLAQLLRQDQNFAGTLGTFDATAFQQVLQQSGLTESEYFSQQTRAAGREQLVVSIFGQPTLTDTAARLLGRYIGDTRTVDYFAINSTSVPSPAEPTEEQLVAYLEANQTDFTTVETRTVDVLSFSPESLGATLDVSEEDIAAEYEATRATLVTPETRTIDQVLLETEEQAATFEAALAAGTDFATVLAETGLEASVVGTRTQAEINDATLADAAFGLEEDGYAVIGGAAGQRVIHVSAITPAAEPTLEEARPELEANVRLDLARQSYLDILDQIEELRAAFQPLSQIAERFGLEVVTVPLTTSGLELSAVADIPAEEYPRVTQAVFAAEPDRLTPAVAMGANRNVFFDLGTVEPVRDQTLEEVRDQVIAAWTREQVDAAISERASEIVARLDAGEALGDIALELGSFAQVSSPFTRTGETGTSIDQSVANVVFAGGPNHHGSAINESGENLVFQVVGVTPAEETLDQGTRDALANDNQRSLYGDFVVGVREAAGGVRINQQALSQVLALNTAQ